VGPPPASLVLLVSRGIAAGFAGELVVLKGNVIVSRLRRLGS
jgi:hypothetical protein